MGVESLFVLRSIHSTQTYSVVRKENFWMLNMVVCRVTARLENVKLQNIWSATLCLSVMLSAYVMRCFHVCCMNLKVKLMIIGQLVLVTEMWIVFMFINVECGPNKKAKLSRRSACINFLSVLIHRPRIWDMTRCLTNILFIDEVLFVKESYWYLLVCNL